MASRETKERALTSALSITLKAAEGGYNKNALSIELQNLYEKIVELKEKTQKDD